ncbi:hypothetical protein ACFQH2_07780 [Natronoarchaeum sp. GCM10025703]|uniref:hypothetical protein n=1 Tax=Natronoarchaeum sp. GCM10025703 TaxID=3252685 RepID=UPI00360A8B6C
MQANSELNNDDRLGIAQMIQRVDLKHEGERDDVFLDNRPDPGATISTATVDDPGNYNEGDSYSTKFAEGGLEGCRRDRIPRLRPRGRRGR